MTTLYFIRHGDISVLKKNIYYGSSDFELSAGGIIQAEKIRDYFRDKAVDFIYSSPLKRAYETAQIAFNRCSSKIVTSNGIGERDFGIWEGLTYGELKEKYPEQCQMWEKDWQDYCIEGGESYSQFYVRVKNFLDQLTLKCIDKAAAIISHSGVICVSIAYLLGMSAGDVYRFKVNRGSISRIKIDENGFGYLDLCNFIP